MDPSGALSTFMSFCCGLTLLMAFSQLAMRRRDARNWLIAALFASLGSYMVRLLYFLHRGGEIDPVLTLFHVPGIYTLGPLLYLNYRLVARRGEAPLAGAWRHFVVPVLFMAGEMVLLAVRSLEARGHVARMVFVGSDDPAVWFVRAMFLAAGLYTLVYQVIILWETLRLFRISEMDAPARIFTAIFCSSALCTVIFLMGLATRERLFLESGFVATGVLVIAAYLLGQRYPEFLQDLRTVLARRRYERSLLSGVDTGLMHDLLVELMEEEKLYADEKVSLQSVAARLMVTPHQLSQFLNERLGMNFNAFVNRYRIEEARQLLTAGTDLSILQIAYSVGFNSKSAFNAAFQKFTGMAPQKYRRVNGETGGRDR